MEIADDDDYEPIYTIYRSMNLEWVPEYTFFSRHEAVNKLLTLEKDLPKDRQWYRLVVTQGEILNKHW